MTSIEVTQSDNILRFSCTGHAGFAERGKDIVCAGISALCIALEQRITRLQKEKQTEIKEYIVSDGCFILHFTETAKSEECLKTILCGFKAIERTYPENCRLI